MGIEITNKTDINITVVIDTDYIKANYSNPSQDPNKPTSINHSSQYMFCNSPRGITDGQGTADLHFQAKVGDYISFRGVSICGNSTDAVIVYEIEHRCGNKVFKQFEPQLKRRKHAAVPDVTSPNGLPATTAPVDFASLDSRVAKCGKEDFNVYFALYTVAEDGETQKLLGYYSWDPSITVQ